jgi:phospholipid-translocating ATPase
MFVAITQFDDAFVNLVTITFTTLICVEMLNVMAEMTQIKWQMVVSVTLTMICYTRSIVIFRQYFEVSYITGPFCYKVILLSLICCLPLWMFRKVMEHCDPTQEEKIMKEQ